MGGTDMVVAELGAAVHPQPVARVREPPDVRRRQWEALGTGLNRLGEIANAEGMRLCYHHHMGTGVMTRAETSTG